MVAAERAHEPVLRFVYVLELVHHDVLQTLLPLAAYLVVLLEDVEREEDEVVVVEAKALLLLVEIAIEDDVARRDGVHVLFSQGIEVHVYHVEIVFRVLDALAYLYHVTRVRIGHVPESEAALLVDTREHGVNVGVVEHEEALGVGNSVAVLLQDGDAEAVEGADVAGVTVAGEGAYALAHLARGLVREGDAEDAARRNAQLADKIGKAPRERPSLARARARYHPHIALRGRHGLELFRVQAL